MATSKSRIQVFLKLSVFETLCRTLQRTTGFSDVPIQTIALAKRIINSFALTITQAIANLRNVGSNQANMRNTNDRAADRCDESKIPAPRKDSVHGMRVERGCTQ